MYSTVFFYVCIIWIIKHQVKYQRLTSYKNAWFSSARELNHGWKTIHLSIGFTTFLMGI
jgi:hypothetical protein